jgi:glycosyltransferase involved in cell wall biosynthesis
LSHYFPPEVNAPASRTYEHARFWVQEPGVEVTVITNHPNHPYGILFQGYKNRWITTDNKDGINIFRVKTYLTPNAGFIRRTLNYFFFMVASTIASISVSKPDVVVATSPQFFCAVAGFVVSRMKRSPFVFELRDIWPESIVTVGAMRPSLPIRLLEIFELFLYKKSARVVALTDAFKDHLINRGIPDSKIEVIKNGVDLSFFSPFPASPGFVHELEAEGKFIISYIGTVGMAHAVDKIVTVAERLQDISEILFLIVGDGAEQRRIKDLTEKKGLHNIRVLNGVSKERVRDYYAVTDLYLVTLKNRTLFRTVIPSKIFEAMAMARPILCAVDGECRKIIEEARSGIYVEPENVEQMIETIERLWQRKESLEVMGQNGRAFVERYFDRNQLAYTYLERLREVAVKG